MVNGKSMIEKEMTMGKFLAVFLGVDIKKGVNVTHKDAKKLFPDLEAISDYDFWHKCKNNPQDYIRVKDKTNFVLYYNPKDYYTRVKENDKDKINSIFNKLDLKSDLVPAECNSNEEGKDNDINDAVVINIYQNFTSIDITQLEYLLNNLKDVDLKNMTKFELCELEKKLKRLKRVASYERNLITSNVHKVQKQLRKLKKESLK